MRQRIFLLITLATFTSASLEAQQPLAKATVAAKPAEAATHSLPVRKVVLYKNGVGYFEHTGTVTGNQHVDIDFTTSQLNDVLQSLTTIDLNGGHIAGAGYNSTTPLEQQLNSLPLGLSASPSVEELYSALRGAHVEIHAAGGAFTGRILNIETTGTAPEDGHPAAVKRTLSVIGDSGAVRIFDLTPSLDLRLLDNDLHQDLARYLQLLADTHSQGLRHLTLDATGTGTRNLLVSYISEVPVWKSTYRIVMVPHTNGTSTATLQGWAVIDNTVGSDWDNVQLSLIAGAPQSFIQPLSQPYYARRPEVPLPVEASTTPQTFESGEEANKEFDRVTSYGKLSAPPPVAQMAPKLAGRGIGSGAGMGAGVAAVTQSVAVDSLSDEEIANLAAETSPSSATTTGFDDYFEYKISQPVTIRKNQSALVPILQTSVPAEQVTLWSPTAPAPLRALWITNASNLTLDRGSFSILENGEFAGEGLLEPIHAGEKRLLSYAVDTSITVRPETTNHELLRSVVIAKGVLTRHLRDYEDTTYTLHNASATTRTVILSEPRREGWEVRGDAKPEETTADDWRFRVEVPAGKTVEYTVTETHAYPRAVSVASYSTPNYDVLFKAADDNAQLEKTLKPVLDARAHLAEIDAQIKMVNDRQKAVRDDEQRQRDNITALKDADKSTTARFVAALNTSEDQIAANQKQLDLLNDQHKAAQAALTDEIQKLDLKLDLAQ